MKKAFTYLLWTLFGLCTVLVVLWLLIGFWYSWTENRNFERMRAKSHLNCNEVPLHCYIRNNDSESIKSYLTTGNPVDIKDGWGRTPLYISVDNDKTEIFRMLINAKANPNTSHENGHTVLFTAVTRSKLNMAKTLLEAGADIDALNGDNFRVTALYECVASSNLDCTKFLLENGADPKIKSSNGFDSLYPLQSKTEDLKSLFADLE